MKKLKIFAHKDLLLSIIILVLITVTYLFNIRPETLITKEHSSSKYIFTGKYELNKISLKEINNLPNISDKVAKAIFNYKDKVNKIEDFRKVKGVGEKKVKMLKKYIKPVQSDK